MEQSQRTSGRVRFRCDHRDRPESSIRWVKVGAEVWAMIKSYTIDRPDMASAHLSSRRRRDQAPSNEAARLFPTIHVSPHEVTQSEVTASQLCEPSPTAVCRSTQEPGILSLEGKIFHKLPCDSIWPTSALFLDRLKTRA